MRGTLLSTTIAPKPLRNGSINRGWTVGPLRLNLLTSPCSTLQTELQPGRPALVLSVCTTAAPICTETMEEVYQLIQERNARETLPFLTIHSSNAYLRSHVDALQARCESLERQYLEQQQLIAEQAQTIELNASNDNTKNQVRLQDQIAKLQGDLNEKIQNEVKHTADSIEKEKELSSLKVEKAALEKTVSNLTMETDRCNEIINHLQSEVENSKSMARLAEKQISGLKDAIRSLQEEADEATKLNRRLLDEVVTEKEKMAEQFNNMNDTIETLQKEANMLRSYAKQRGPMGFLGGLSPLRRGDKHLPDAETSSSNDTDAKPRRQWGAVGAVVPSQPLYTIKAHRDDATCVRYDATNLNRVATASSDATVRVFDTSNGQLESTFSAGGRLPLIGVDISGDIVCGCGADKTCRYVVGVLLGIILTTTFDQLSRSTCMLGYGISKQRE